MLSTFRFLFVIGAVLTSLWAQADHHEVRKVAYKSLIAQNSQDVMKIKLGMDKEQALGFMKNIYASVNNGPVYNPWKIESFENKEVYFYITSPHPPFTPIRERQTTPVIFQNDKVVGIGIQYYSQLRHNIAQANEMIVPDSSQNSSSNDRDAKENGQTIEARLLKLKQLYDAGLIDKAAYEAQQMRILDGL